MSDATRLDPERLAEIDELERFQRGARDEVARLFIESLGRDLARVDDAIAAGDAESLRQAMHSIKGCAAGIGAAQVAAMSSRLERQARDGNVASVAQEIEALRHATAAAFEAVRDWQHGGLAAAPD